MPSWISKLSRKSDVRDSLFQKCTVCKKLCQSSKLLNDVEFYGVVRTTGEKTLGDPYNRIPPKLDDFFTDRIRTATSGTMGRSL